MNLQINSILTRNQNKQYHNDFIFFGDFKSNYVNHQSVDIRLNMTMLNRLFLIIISFLCYFTQIFRKN